MVTKATGLWTRCDRVQDIRTAQRAFALLGVDTQMRLYGVADDRNGEAIFADRGIRVLHFGRRWITVEVDGESAEVDLDGASRGYVVISLA